MFEMRRLRQSLVDYYISSRESLVEELKRESWELLEGVSFATEYPNLEQIAWVIVRRTRLTDNSSLEGPNSEQLQEAVEAKAEEMREAILSDGYYMDREECFIVLGARRGAS